MSKKTLDCNRNIYYQQDYNEGGETCPCNIDFICFDGNMDYDDENLKHDIEMAADIIKKIREASS